MKTWRWWHLPDRPVLVMAGATFPPQARRWRSLVVPVARTLRHERVRLIPATFPEYLRGRQRVVTLLRTAMRDAPEQVVARLECPLVVMRGQHDALCSATWAAELAERAPRSRVVTLPGAHNFVFDHPTAASRALRALVS